MKPVVKVVNGFDSRSASIREAPGASTIYTCSHLLTGPGTYINEASATGTPPGELPIAHLSNRVETVVPAAPGSQPLTGGSIPPTAVGGVREFCASALPPLHVPSGPKRRPFTLHIPSPGIKQITFYIDGHRLKTLKQSQARGGSFSVRINPAALSFGPHTLSVRALPSSPYCAAAAASGVIVHPLAAGRTVRNFTG